MHATSLGKKLAAEIVVDSLEVNWELEAAL
jgi:hypothetical protein